MNSGKNVLNTIFDMYKRLDVSDHEKVQEFGLKVYTLLVETGFLNDNLTPTNKPTNSEILDLIIVDLLEVRKEYNGKLTESSYYEDTIDFSDELFGHKVIKTLGINLNKLR